MTRTAAFALVFSLALPTLAHAADFAPSQVHLLPQLALGAAPVSPTFLLGATEEAAATVVKAKRTTIFGLPLNEGPVDRVLRGVVAATLVGIGSYRLYTNQGSATWSGVILGVSLIPILTAATGYCPLYHLFGVDYTG